MKHLIKFNESKKEINLQIFFDYINTLDNTEHINIRTFKNLMMQNIPYAIINAYSNDQYNLGNGFDIDNCNNVYKPKTIEEEKDFFFKRYPLGFIIDNEIYFINNFFESRHKFLGLKLFYENNKDKYPEIKLHSF